MGYALYISLDDYIPEILAATRVGQVWGLPLNPSTLVMYCSKDLFKQAGLLRSSAKLLMQLSLGARHPRQL